MHSQGGYTHRGDITAVIMEADGWEDNLIHNRLAPTITVEDEKGEYPVFKKASGSLLKREANIKRAPGANFARGELGYEWDNYSTEEYGFEIPLDGVSKKKADAYFDSAAITARMAKRKLLLDREIRVATALFNASTFDANNSLTAYTIANIATFDIGLDVDLAKQVLLARGESDNNLSLALSNAVFIRARASTKMQNRLRGIGVASDTILGVDAAAFAEALGVKEVIIGKNYYDAAGEGLAYSGTAIYGNTYMWLGRLGNSGGPEQMLQGGALNTLCWSKYGPEWTVESYMEPQKDSEIFRVKQYLSEKVVNANVGTLIGTQYS